LRSVDADLTSVNDALQRERATMVDTLERADRSTVEEVAGLPENLLLKVETDIVATVPETLDLQDPLRDRRRNGVEQRSTGSNDRRPGHDLWQDRQRKLIATAT
jgi:hypothetical protein